MKLSEIARYWAAKELTEIGTGPDGTVTFQAPFATPAFTVRIPAIPGKSPRLAIGAEAAPLAEVPGPLKLKSGTWTRDGETHLAACFDLPKGASAIRLDG